MKTKLRERLQELDGTEINRITTMDLRKCILLLEHIEENEWLLVSYKLMPPDHIFD